MSHSELLARVHTLNDLSSRKINALQPHIDELECSLTALEAAPSSLARQAWTSQVARDTARLVLAAIQG